MRPILALVPALLAGADAAEPYSPPLRRDYPDNVYWGDTHLHTYLSPDAFPLGTLVTPDQAYRFAKGETIRATGGDEARLRRPLDFLMVSDHAENMGVLPRLAAGEPGLLKSADGRRFFEVLAGTPALRDVLRAESIEEFNVGNTALSKAKGAKSGDYGIGEDFIGDVWASVVAVAERHNDPGRFTTFAGYEYSSGSPMLHRNVMFAGGPGQTLQARPFSSYDSRNPEDLWAYLESYREATGGDVIAIPHNSNLSGGNMFKTVTYEGKALSREYARVRSSIEPVIEVTQIKGDSETLPSISPTDEFADHETWANLAKPQTEAEARRSYARSALQTGLALGAELGVNPFKFGMIGSTDSHTGLATADEDNFWGKMGANEPNPYRGRTQAQFSSSGYAAVWARENTREAIFAAMKRREVYATTGPRITLRFFGGWDYVGDDAASPNLAEIGYSKGVPMGGDLAHQTGDEAPSFLVSAAKDPDGANLDRVQVVKGWRDAHGNVHEKIYDVAWSGDRMIDDGRLPAVGSTVDLETASYVNSIGSAALATTWTDPAFNPREAAFYYVRVIQIPTPRWTTYDAKYYNLRDSPRQVIRERAYSSPIWYTPQGF